ncbi:MAG: TM2 domain-containing protein [Clostridia bacterium]|nr:TM2 domain-containing protein [Clostridia bacterium]
MNTENQAVESTFVDKQKVDMYIMANQHYFPAEKIIFLKEKLYSLSESKFSMLSAIELKNPTTLLIISLLIGTLGIDRFMLGDTGMGILKLLTAGCCGIMTIVDWFSVTNKTKEKNFTNIMLML